MTLSGTMSSFGLVARQAFQEAVAATINNLLPAAGVLPSNVQLSVAPASIQVTVSITMQMQSAANSVATLFRALTVAELSDALQQTVLDVSTPTVEAVVFDGPSPPPPASPPPLLPPPAAPSPDQPPPLPPLPPVPTWPPLLPSQRNTLNVANNWTVSWWLVWQFWLCTVVALVILVMGCFLVHNVGLAKRRSKETKATAVAPEVHLAEDVTFHGASASPATCSPLPFAHVEASPSATGSPNHSSHVESPLSPSDRQAIIALAEHALAEIEQPSGSSVELDSLQASTWPVAILPADPPLSPSEQQAIVSFAETFVASRTAQHTADERQAVVALAMHYVSTHSSKLGPSEEQAIVALAEQYLSSRSEQEQALAELTLAGAAPQNVTTRAPRLSAARSDVEASESEEESEDVEPEPTQALQEPASMTWPTDAMPMPADVQYRSAEAIAPTTTTKVLNLDVVAMSPLLPVAEAPAAPPTVLPTGGDIDSHQPPPPVVVPSDLSADRFRSPLHAMGPSGFPESGRVDLRPPGHTESPPFTGSPHAWSEFELDSIQKTPHVEEIDSTRAERALRRMVNGEEDSLPSIPISRPAAPDPSVLPVPPLWPTSPRAPNYSANNFTPVGGSAMARSAAFSSLGLPAAPLAQRQASPIPHGFPPDSPGVKNPRVPALIQEPSHSQPLSLLSPQYPLPQYNPQMARIEVVMSHRHSFMPMQPPSGVREEPRSRSPPPRASPTFDSPRRGAGRRTTQRSPHRPPASPRRSPPTGDATRTTFYL